MISNMEWLECCVRVTILCKNWQDIRAHQLGLLSTFDDWVEIDWLPRRWWMCNSSSSESILHKIRIPSPVMDISMSNYRYREPCDLTKAHTYSTWRQHEIEKLFSLCFFYIFHSVRWWKWGDWIEFNMKSWSQSHQRIMTWMDDMFEHMWDTVELCSLHIWVD